MRDHTKEFLQERLLKEGVLHVSWDLKIWTHQVLYKLVFGQATTWEEANAFCNLQTTMLAHGTVSQVLPGSLYGLLGVKDIAYSVEKTVKKYEELLLPRFGDRLKKFDCAPSPSCSLQLASGIFDALYAAGGLSVPGAIASGLGVLYSEHKTNPAKGFTIPLGKEAEFFWESLRYFPPVYGFPYWTTRPTCDGITPGDTIALELPYGQSEACPRLPVNTQTGFSPVNQWQGGARVVLDIGRAGWDEHRWGVNASKFVLRPQAEYKRNSLNFADMAVDAKVAGGKNNRVCPAKQLSIAMGAVFFQVFKKEDWIAHSAQDIEMDPFGPFTQISDFDLRAATLEG